MRKNQVKIKGLWVPRLFIWILGFIHGHIFKTAGIDPDTGYVCSSYTTGKTKLFAEASSIRVKKLEEELKAVRFEAFDLMAQEAFVRKSLETDVEGNASGTIDERRCSERCAARRDSYEKRHTEILRRLGEIDNKIRSCEVNAREELDAVASALQSRFATYAHGMLLCPIQSRMIPPVEYNYCFDLYQKSHLAEEKQLRHILNEVFDYE